MTDKHQQLPPTFGQSPTNILLVAVLGVLTVVLAYQMWSSGTTEGASNGGTQSQRDVTPKGQMTAAEKNTIAVFKEASPSVVFIRTKGFQPYVFGAGGEEKELSSGTGFVWDRQGHIVTNLHVLRDALLNTDSELEVQFADKSVVDADIIGAVSEFDIAILKVTADDEHLKPINVGTSDDLQVGQQVLAIGSPFGFDQTLSTGVIGGLNRSVATEDTRGMLAGLIQTDAAINPGNSGGPLLDSSGRMIGVNTAIVSPTGAYSGLGFAVPSANVIESVEMVLRESTNNRKAILGVTILSPEHALALRLPKEISDRGLFIKQVEAGGPAAKAQLMPTQQRGIRIFWGDQIAKVDGQKVTSVEDLQNILAMHAPGDTVTIEFYRAYDLLSVEVTLQAQKLFW